MSGSIKNQDYALSAKQVKALWPLLYNYWYKSRAMRTREFVRNILLRPRKDKEKRAKYTERILHLNREINKLNDKIESILHPAEEQGK